MPDLIDNLDDRKEVQDLFKNLKERLPTLQELYAQCADHWGYEDPIYRFYHHSFKVYKLQARTLEIVEALQKLAPDLPLNKQFMQIVAEGTGKKFSFKDNYNWPAVTRPILEAFFHARFFLEMAIKYGNELEYPPQRLPSGWAAILYLYNRR